MLDRSLLRLQTCRLRRYGLSMRQIGRMTGQSVRDVFKTLHRHRDNAQKRYKPSEIKFERVDKYTCPGCGLEVVLFPCVACLARHALPNQRGKSQRTQARL